MNSQKIELVIIDPQNDFCVPNGTLPGVTTGRLLVPGAHDDMKRLAGWIKKNVMKLSNIRVTLDSHHIVDVAHRWFWVDKDGNHPLPLSEAITKNGIPTFISSKDIKDGIWMPANYSPEITKRMIAYCEALEAGNNKFPLTIWDQHCVIGTPGAAIVPELQDALDEWCLKRFANVDYLTKGSNPYTEHYGAFEAEVKDPADASTQTNTQAIQAIENNDLIIWTGEASTHCLMTSMRQAFSVFGPDAIKKSIILTDCTSPIPAFAKHFDDFLDEFRPKGLRTETTQTFLA